jgi:hypothetical protein
LFSLLVDYVFVKPFGDPVFFPCAFAILPVFQHKNEVAFNYLTDAIQHNTPVATTFYIKLGRIDNFELVGKYAADSTGC